MSNSVYIFAGEGYMVRHSLNALRRALDIDFPEVNETEYKTMPKTDELIAACASMPMMATHRLIAVMDCGLLGAKGGKEEAKKLADYLERLPDSTVLVLCTEAALDKRRVLYKRVKEMGQIKEFGAPKREDCIRFAIDHAKAQGVELPRNIASLLVDIVGCDFYVLENEVSKLAIYSGGKQISKADVAACASRSLEYNVFEIHGLFVNKKSAQARALLGDIMGAERPEALIGLFARKIRDMYKVKAMLDAGYSSHAIAKPLRMKPFVVDIQVRECRRFSAESLRSALIKLANLDHAIKSGGADASIALPGTLIDIYEL